MILSENNQQRWVTMSPACLSINPTVLMIHLPNKISNYKIEIPSVLPLNYTGWISENKNKDLKF